MIDRTLGELIREARKQRGLSVRELARQVGISHPFLSRIESDRRSPSDAVMSNLSRLLQIPASQLRQHSVAHALADFKSLAENDRSIYVGFLRTAQGIKQRQITIASFRQRLLKGC